MSTKPKRTPLEGRLSFTEEECANRFDRCSCLFQLWRDGTCIAQSPSYDAHLAARRLLE